MVLFAAEAMDEGRDYRFFWILAFALLLLTRVPAMPSYFGVDNVNLALSLEKFDPRIHQPQPPGYPFFVAFARVINFFLHDARRTFLFVSLLISGLCLPLAYSLGNRMFSRSAGFTAAFLLLVNPVFWYAGIDPNGGPLRPFLGLFALLTAYCSWRCWMGEKSFALWSAIALGIGSGFRPDLIAFLFPLWFIAAWLGTKSWRTVLLGCAVLSAIVLVWAGAVVLSMRGTSLRDDIQIFTKLMLDYTVSQSRPESVVFGSSIIAWLRQINRLVIWNGLAVVTWIWTVPFYFLARKRVSLASSQALFLALWLVPGLVIQALVHIGAPGHTLFSVAALCIVGGYLLSLAPVRDMVLGIALVLNVMLFLNFFPLPPGVVASTDSVPSIKNALLFGTFESSIGQVRWLDEITRATLSELQQFTPKDRPSIIISTDMFAKQWFMNWRIGRYYATDQDFWILYNNLPKKRAELIRRDALLDVREIEPLRVPIFQEGRILWLIEPESAVYKELAEHQKVMGGKYVFYTEVTRNSSRFWIAGFEIVPSLFSFLPQTARVNAN